MKFLFVEPISQLKGKIPFVYRRQYNDFVVLREDRVVLLTWPNNRLAGENLSVDSNDRICSSNDCFIFVIL